MRRSGNRAVPFRLLYHPLVLSEDLPTLHPDVRARLRCALRERIALQPAHYGKALRETLKGLWSLRVGDYRIIYTIEEGDVLVLRIGHRREVYRSASRRSPTTQE